LYKAYFTSLPGSNIECSEETLRYIEINYRLEDPQVVAARLLFNLLPDRATNVNPLSVEAFVELVRTVMKEVLLVVGTEAKKLSA